MIGILCLLLDAGLAIFFRWLAVHNYGATPLQGLCVFLGTFCLLRIESQLCLLRHKIK